MRLGELFEAIVEMREGSVERDPPRPGDAPASVEGRAPKHAQEQARLLTRGVRYAFAMASVIGLAIGVSAVSALTAGDGATPINVLYLIAVTMLLPIATLMGTLVLTARAARGAFSDGFVTDIAHACVQAGVKLAAYSLDRQKPEAQLQTRAALGALRGDYASMRPVVPWLLQRLAQSFSLALSAGFVLALFLRILGTSHAFAWQSTFFGEDLQYLLPTLVELLSAPFAWLPVDGVPPSDALIQATQYIRYENSYIGGPEHAIESARLSEQWVPFLLIGAAFWGVLPRIATLVYLGGRQRGAIQTVLQKSEALRRTQRALQHIDVARPAPESQALASAALAQAAGEQPATQDAVEVAKKHGPSDAPASAAVLYWEQDAPPRPDALKTLEDALRLRPQFTAALGNRAADDAQTLDIIRQQKPERVLLLVEPFANPGAGFKRQIRALREAVGAQTPIIIVLRWLENGHPQAIPPRMLEVWKQSIQALGDRATMHHIPRVSPAEQAPNTPSTPDGGTP